MEFDALVVGCGFSGAVCARVLAEEFGMRVRIIDKRNHIAGNMYDEKDEQGILVHRYGPHIFHTNSDEAFSYIRPFSEWFAYEHRVLGKIKDKLVPIPFNFKSIDMLFPAEKAESLKTKLPAAFPGREKVTVSELVGAEDAELGELGRFVFDYVFKNYTAKQWGTPVETLDSGVINRVPVVLSYDDRYFQDAIQMTPKHGFTALFENLLSHPNISVALGCDAKCHLTLDCNAGTMQFDGRPFDGICIYTGPADELFDYAYGPLPYRSLHMVFEHHDKTAFQPASVVNYPNDGEFTRITEFKKLTGQKKSASTTVMYEYPRAYVRGSDEAGIPYYAILNDENRKLHAKYAALAEKIPGLHLCGRLADYAYYNMDAAILAALHLARSVVE